MYNKIVIKCIKCGSQKRKYITFKSMDLEKCWIRLFITCECGETFEKKLQIGDGHLDELYYLFRVKEYNEPHEVNRSYWSKFEGVQGEEENLFNKSKAYYTSESIFVKQIIIDQAQDAWVAKYQFYEKHKKLFQIPNSVRFPHEEY